MRKSPANTDQPINTTNPTTLPANDLITDETALNVALLQAQATLRELGDTAHARGILVLVNGMENAGKGEAVRQLTEWMDARHLKVHATMGQHPSHYQPIWQRHTAQLPRHGEVAVYFGNWYADLIRYVFDSGDNLDTDRLAQLMEDIEAFEQDLINNHTEIVKVWFRVDDKTLKKRLDDDEPDPEQLYHIDWHKTKHVKRFNAFSEQLLDKQPSWHAICGNDTDQSNVEFANIVLNRMQQMIAQATASKPTPPLPATTSQPFESAPIPAALQHIANSDISKTDYKQALEAKQITLAKRLRQRGQRHIVMVFEGMDAAGKGGAIKRIIQALDPREFVIHPIAAPTEEEIQHPYLWRFWTRLPHDEYADIDLDIDYLLSHCDHDKRKALTHHRRNSIVTIFDRSWYGRVLVERVEGFAKPHEWQRAYGEINRFEQDLIQNGAIVIKFWLAISSEEELKRFNAREVTPNKQHKITEEDWRNRGKWDDYVQAAADMLANTSTEQCPWHIIATDSKYEARLQVLDAVIDTLTHALKS